MFSYFIIIMAGIFWIFRLMVAIMFSTGTAFIDVPMNFTFEVVLLFISFICIVLISKRRMIGAVVYLIAQCSYFGVEAYKTLEIVVEGQPVIGDYVSLLISLFAVLIPILAIMDIGLSSGKKGSRRNKNSRWFYNSTEHDRKLDDRADTNQYKF